jgi:hypothetical protein
MVSEFLLDIWVVAGPELHESVAIETINLEFTP